MSVRESFKSHISELCKDMGLGSKTLDSLCELYYKGLSDDSTEEAIAAAANAVVPFAKLLQSEGTRVSAELRKKLESQSKPLEPKVGSSDVEPKVDVDDKYSSLEKQIQTLMDRLQKKEVADEAAAFKSRVSESAKKIGLPDTIAQQIVIPDGADIDETLTAFKQAMVNSSLQPLDGDGSGGVKKSDSPSDESLKSTIEDVLAIKK